MRLLRYHLSLRSHRKSYDVFPLRGNFAVTLEKHGNTKKKTSFYLSPT